MSLIIDGYNLMHAAGIIALGSGAGSLERSRVALLNFIAENVAEAELATTTVVFDAAAAPPGLPRKLSHRGVTVHFSTGYNDADELIEELILQSTSPRKLTVVSSDHRLHRAARRRKAQPIDSDRWHLQVLAERHQRELTQPSAPQKPAIPIASSEVEYWLKQFTEEPAQAPRFAPPPQVVKKAGGAPKPIPPAAAPKRNPAPPAAAHPTADKQPSAKPCPKKPPATARPKGTKSKPVARRKPRSIRETPAEGLLAGDEIFPQEYLDSIDEE